MHRPLLLLLAACLVSATPVSAQNTPAPDAWAAVARPPLLPGTTYGPIADSTVVRLVVDRLVTSRTADVGDSVMLRVDAPVVSGERVVIAKGTSVVGTVTSVKRAGMRGKAGQLAISPGSVTALDGQQIPLAVANREGRNRGGLYTAASMVSLPLMLVKGNEMELKPGTVLEAVTVGNRFLVWETSYGSVAAANPGTALAGGFIPALRPIPPGFGAFDRFVSTDLISSRGRMKINLVREGLGLSFWWAAFDQTSGTGMELVKKRDTNELMVLGWGTPRGATARLLSADEIELQYHLPDSTLVTEQYLVTESGAIEHTVSNLLPSNTVYRPATPATIAQARRQATRDEVFRQETLARREAYSREQAAEYRREEAAKRAERTAAIQGMIQATGTAVAEALQDQADARAANAARAQAAADRAAAAQAERDANAPTTRAAAADPAMAAAATTAAEARAQQDAARRTETPRLQANPAGASESGSSGASTDTDANRCVTDAETKLNDTYAGNTSASVLNGCGQPVDVRICLMAEKSNGTTGWNCGLRNGVPSQGKASFSSFKATGPVFVDARVSGSRTPLAYPPGYR